MAQDRIYFWLISNIYKLDVANEKALGPREKYYELYPKDKLAEHLTAFCEELLKTTSQVKNGTSVPILYEKLKDLEATINRDPDEEEDALERDELLRR